MLNTRDRIFLYQFLAQEKEQAASSEELLHEFIAEAEPQKKHKKALANALILIPKMTLYTALKQARVIPEDEAVLLCFSEKFEKTEISVLKAVASSLNSKSLLTRKIRTVFIYPFILMIELFIILTLSLFWLLPQMHFFFTRLRIVPPKYLQFIFALQNSARRFIDIENLYAVLIVASAGWLVYQLLRLRVVQETLHAALIHTCGPLKIIRLWLLHDIFSKLSALARAREPLHKTLRPIARITANRVYQKNLFELADVLEKKKNLRGYLTLRKNKTLYPVFVRRALIRGQKQQFSAYMQSVSKQLNDELEIEIKQFISLIEPVLILSIALFVLVLGLTLQNMLSQIYTLATVN